LAAPAVDLAAYLAACVPRYETGEFPPFSTPFGSEPIAATAKTASALAPASKPGKLPSSIRRATSQPSPACAAALGPSAACAGAAAPSIPSSAATIASTDTICFMTILSYLGQTTESP